MSTRKNEVFGEAVVGFFMVAVIAMLAYFTIVISGVDLVSGRDTARMRISFEQVGGLKDHDNVMYRGTKVGKVHHVDVAVSNLIVTVDIDKNVILRESYRISVCNLSMFGGNYLLLEEGEGQPLDLATFAFRGETPTDWMRDVTEIARNVREITSMSAIKGIVTNAEVVSRKAKEFSDTANRVALRADAIAEKMQGIVDRVNRGEGTLGKILSADSRVYDDLQATVTDAKSAMADARQITQKMNNDEMIANLKEGIAAFRKTIEKMNPGETLARANELVDNMNIVVRRLRDGQGTAGKLMANDGMYTEVEGLIRDCRQIIDNYRDTTPISTFSSLAAGAL